MVKDWQSYLAEHYFHDFKAFLAGTVHDRHHFHEEQNGKRILLCDCDPHFLANSLGHAGILDGKRFRIAAFMESVLLAGVHEYDRGNYGTYCLRTPHLLHVHPHGKTGILHPQFLLLTSKPWSERDCQLLDEGVHLLLKQWLASYQLMFSHGNGVSVIAGLSRDRDLNYDFHGHLPDRVIRVYRQGIADVSGEMSDLRAGVMRVA